MKGQLEPSFQSLLKAILLAKGLVAAQGGTVPMLSDVGLMEAHDLEKPHILAHQHLHLPVIGGT